MARYKTLFFGNLFWLLVISLLNTSCKKGPTTHTSNRMCVNVKDYITNQPIANASVTIYVEAADGSGTGLSGVSDANGNAFIEYADYIYLNEIEVQAVGYERNCGPLIFDQDIKITREISMLKRTSFIQFHVINQPPGYLIDSFLVIMRSNINRCSGEGWLYPQVGINLDTTFTIPAVAGSNNIQWELCRYYTIIRDSTFDVNVLTGDTAFIRIDY